MFVNIEHLMTNENTFCIVLQIGNKMKKQTKKTYFNITDLDVLFVLNLYFTKP